MLNPISKKIIYGLIIIAIVFTFTACDNNKRTEPKDKNVEVDSLEANNELHEPSKDSLKNNNQFLDSWIGDFIFTEYFNSKDYTKFYGVFISKENNNYSAKINIDDTGLGVYSNIQAKISGDANHIDFIFYDYLSDETNTNKPYKLGDNLLSFTKTDTGIITHWGKIVPTNDINKVDGTYFKIRENSEGYVGHWYNSIPFTGGNSTTIEIKEMSDTSVSFHLYFCRTYYYDGINIKLENNIAKFVDDGDYKTSGTIEFVNKSIIVNIDETNLPILKPEKTIFNYKVNKFNAVSMTPNNGATDVVLDKGIEIDFGRSVVPTINPTIFIRKANVPIDSGDGYVEMDVEVKGNKLILLPNYDAMKSFNQVIESGQKYEFTIEEGQYRDAVGNINNDLVFEFTTR